MLNKSINTIATLTTGPGPRGPKHFGLSGAQNFEFNNESNLKIKGKVSHASPLAIQPFLPDYRLLYVFQYVLICRGGGAQWVVNLWGCSESKYQIKSIAIANNLL